MNPYWRAPDVRTGRQPDGAVAAAWADLLLEFTDPCRLAVFSAPAALGLAASVPHWVRPGSEVVFVTDPAPAAADHAVVLLPAALATYAPRSTYADGQAYCDVHWQMAAPDAVAERLTGRCDAACFLSLPPPALLADQMRLAKPLLRPTSWLAGPVPRTPRHAGDLSNLLSRLTADWSGTLAERGPLWVIRLRPAYR